MVMFLVLLLGISVAPCQGQSRTPYVPKNLHSALINVPGILSV